MDQELLYIGALFMSLLGGYSVAFFSFKSTLLQKVTFGRLLGFTVTFFFSFVLIAWALFAIVASQFPFGR